MAAPVLVFLVCFGIGILAAARWVPELAAGPVGGLAFFTVCGLLAAALGLAGVQASLTYHELHIPATSVPLQPEVMASGLRSILLDGGTLVGLAAVLYLVAARRGRLVPAHSSVDPGTEMESTARGRESEE